jgi:hypothetical protein
VYFGTGDAVPADLRSRAAAARRPRVEATDRRRARHARLSTRPRDHRLLTAFRLRGPHGPVRLEAKPGERGTARRTSRWARPCPGSGSLPVRSPLSPE